MNNKELEVATNKILEIKSKYKNGENLVICKKLAEPHLLILNIEAKKIADNYGYSYKEVDFEAILGVIKKKNEKING